MDEFQGEELARADEALVVFVDEVEREDGEEVGEEEVDGEVRVGVADEVEPVAAGGKGRGVVCVGIERGRPVVALILVIP